MNWDNLSEVEAIMNAIIRAKQYAAVKEQAC